MRPLIALTLAVCCLAAARPAAAQTATPPDKAPAQSGRMLAIDRWISRPSPITLTADQRQKFDSLRTDYVRETDALRDASKAGGEMAVVMKMAELTARYQTKVRDLLTPEQEAVFQKNVDADVIKP